MLLGSTSIASWIDNSLGSLTALEGRVRRGFQFVPPNVSTSALAGVVTVDGSKNLVFYSPPGKRVGLH